MDPQKLIIKIQLREYIKHTRMTDPYMKGPLGLTALHI
jgi:hypothetical protein